jgi:hypothetical protein
MRYGGWCKEEGVKKESNKKLHNHRNNIVTPMVLILQSKAVKKVHGDYLTCKAFNGRVVCSWLADCLVKASRLVAYCKNMLAPHSGLIIATSNF